MRIFDKFAQFLLRSRANAVVTATVLVFAPIFRLISWATLGLVTLRKGAIEGSVVLVAMVLAIIGMGVGAYYFAPPALAAHHMQLSVLWALAGLLLSSVLVWFLAIMLHQYASWSKVLQAGLWSCVAVIAVSHLALPDMLAMWMPIVKSSIQEMVKQIPSLHLSSVDDFATRASQFMTGVQVLMALLASLLSLLIARWWQASLFNPGGLRQELLLMRLGVPEAVLLGACMLLVLTDTSATGKAIVIDAAPV